MSETATANTTEKTTDTLTELLSAASFAESKVEQMPIIAEHFTEIDENISEQNRLLAGISTLLANSSDEDLQKGFNKLLVQSIIAKIDELINLQVNEIIHDKDFKYIEAQLISLNELIERTNFDANIKVDILDVSKEELSEDFESNSVDIAGSELFKKIYVKEYDQYGGEPYGSIIGLYEFDRSTEDLEWLSTIGKIANASHAPFVASVSPSFFDMENIEELAAVRDLEGMMKHPKFRQWNQLRKTEQAAYIGLTLPRILLREPYDPENYPAAKSLKQFKETLNPLNEDDYVWGSSAILFASNLTRAFEKTGWCQYIRGPRAGGLIEELPLHLFNVRGRDEIKAPIQMLIPDFRELEFANCGFIPLIYNKNSDSACFFSSQSIKAIEVFEDPKDSENSQMLANMAYTYSITRIAHYVKSMMRDNIGSNADADYIREELSKWIFDYVTTVINPDDPTLQRFPFKSANIEVMPIVGKVGWYKCNISVLPHIQLEGIDVELRIDTRLG